MTEPKTKTCAACGEKKPIDTFPRTRAGGPKGNGKAYVGRHCRPCVNKDAATVHTPIAALPTEAEMRDWYQKGCRI